MREIKFNAWLKQHEIMVTVDSIDFAEGEIMIIDDTGIDRYFPFEEIELLQYTGLKDKNGEEIYEGYLVKWIIESINYPGVFREHICEVFRNKQGAYRLRGKTIYETELCCNRKKVEVIGNIYEHSHLLEGATNGSS
ncbi:YopX family protein [Oceanobacillus oncorhynchi]|uniref:YopX family protein n=1 Tax=Oceanobacillus oncorhynchi TaxID=545501 RepID=UPI002F96D215